MELEKLKTAHQAIFSHVLKIGQSFLKCTFEEAEKNYLVVPLRLLEINAALSASSPKLSIDFKSVYLLTELQSSLQNLKPVPWPTAKEEFRNTVVIAKHCQQKVLYEVKEVAETTNLSSPFPNLCAAPTYLQYFTEKYRYCFTDNCQFALKCKILGTASSYYQLLKCRFKNIVGENTKKSEKRGKVIDLFPELCYWYPLPANLWKLIRCLPSILWRVECLLTVEALHSRITVDTGIGRLPNGSEFTTYINFRGYKDMGYGNLATQKYVPGKYHHSQHLLLSEAEMFSLTDHNPQDAPLRSPDNALLLQALTTKSAGDSVNLERLETLGDAFLKFSTSVFLYCERPSAHEGKLTDARSRRVGNFNLFYLAKQRGIPASVFSNNFDPLQMWIPPCFASDSEDHSLQAACASPVDQPDSPSRESDQRDSPSQEDDQPEVVLTEELQCSVPVPHHSNLHLYHKLSDKAVADSMESIIGAYLVSGGILAALKIMVWMGIKIVTGERDRRDDPVGSSLSLIDRISAKMARMEISINTPSLFISGSSAIVEDFFSPSPRLWGGEQEHQQQTELNRLLDIAMGGKNSSEIIGWKFSDRRLLLQAFTHASYTKNRLTDSYQRLEFLGDAVLDYLVTCHIYSKFPWYNPGNITNMRSALVNNITFAQLAVELKLNSALLHNSPFLFKKIQLYLADIQKSPMEVNFGRSNTQFFDDSKNVSTKMKVCIFFFLHLMFSTKRLSYTVILALLFLPQMFFVGCPSCCYLFATQVVVNLCCPPKLLLFFVGHVSCGCLLATQAVVIVCWQPKLFLLFVGTQAVLCCPTVAVVVMNCSCIAVLCATPFSVKCCEFRAASVHCNSCLC